jgi:hypothetical protein
MPKSLTITEQLLEQADHLALRDKTKPYQANLRRAVSASYYALFHFLASECARNIAGTASSDDPFRDLVSRSFVHSDMAEASKRFTKGSSDLPIVVRSALASMAIHASVQQVASVFVTLQEERHRADYDLSRSFVREQVVATLQRSKSAIAAWKSTQSDPSARAYLYALLLWRQIKSK